MKKESLETHPQTPTRTILKQKPILLLRRLLATAECDFSPSDLSLLLDAIGVVFQYNQNEQWHTSAMSVFGAILGNLQAHQKELSG